MFLTLWATPRSTSTAFEWMMRQRGDFDCYHESFNELYYYGEDRQSERDGDVPAKPGHTYSSVWCNLKDNSNSRNVFLKEFAYSIEHFITDEMLQFMTHSFLIRDPRKVIQGLHNHWADCTLQEVGFESLYQLFERVRSLLESDPIVIHSEDLLSNPTGTIKAYCETVGIEFIPEALQWEPGERKEVSWYDQGAGVWHDSLRQSTGIAPQQSKYPPIEDDARLVDLYEKSIPYYEALNAFRLKL